MVDGFGLATGREPWGVAALVQAVAETLAERFTACSVRGEISGFSRAASGHCYFNLKDAHSGAALLRCAMFRRSAGLLAFMPADGQLVDVRGRLGVYEARGELQLVVEAMQRGGAGALYEQFLRLKARLEAEGLFDPGRKRALAPFPRRIGVVTSLGAAALRDVLTALARRAPHVEVLLYPSPVQGAEAPAALVDSIVRASSRAEVDTLLVCRGGGSLEDLWAFNDERVVRAIVASTIPVVCGVGHETDVTLADFAADLRAATPTAAAELAAPATQVCLDQLGAYAALLQRRMHEAQDRHAQRLDRSAMRLVRPAEAVRRQIRRLEVFAHRLNAALTHDAALRRRHHDELGSRQRRAAAVALATCAQRLGAVQGRLRSLDPEQVLQRGYAWLLDASGRPLMAADQTRVGAALVARLRDGALGLVVTGIEPP